MKPVLLSPERLPGWKSFLIIYSLILICTTAVFELYSLQGKSGFNFTYAVYAEYAVLGLFTLLLSGLLYIIYRRRKIRHLSLITFTVSSMADGAYHFVAVPASLTSAEFLTRFFVYLQASVPAQKIQSILRDFSPYLEVRRRDELFEIARDVTLGESGIKNGDICQVRGKPKKVNV